MTTKPSTSGGKAGGETKVSSPASQSKASTKQNKGSGRKSEGFDQRPYHADKVAHGEIGIKGKWSAWPDFGD